MAAHSNLHERLRRHLPSFPPSDPSAPTPQVPEQPVKVCVGVVRVPVQDVVAHAQIVPGKVRRRVGNGVELVPEHSALPGRRGDVGRRDRHRYGGAPLLLLARARRGDDGALHGALGRAGLLGRLGPDPARLGR